MMSHICIPTPLAAQPGRQQDYRFCARIRKHEPLLSNLASRRCSRKTYFVAGPHRMSERPQPIARTVRRTPRNRSRPMRCEHTLQTGCNLPPRGHLKSRSSGEGGFQERLSYVRPRGGNTLADRSTNPQMRSGTSMRTGKPEETLINLGDARAGPLRLHHWREESSHRVAGVAHAEASAVFRGASLVSCRRALSVPFPA